MEPIVAILLLFISVYPVYLVWRFLTLGIKAFKKYLFEQPYYTDYREDEE